MQIYKEMKIYTQMQICTQMQNTQKVVFSAFISNFNRFKFDKFQYRFGMSRQLWKGDFQIEVWQKIQTLNPANPGMVLQSGRSLGKVFSL